MNAEVIKAPNQLSESGHRYWINERKSIFLAGSIEMGKAENWQDRLTNYLAKETIIIYNPRRDDWDSSWKQEKTNPQFYEQVTWELDKLECSTVIAVYFDPATQSPVTLMELGLHARSGKLVVCCPDGFWRQGNVEIVCQKYGIPFFREQESWMVEIKNRLI